MDYKDSVAIYIRKSRSDPDDESIEETLSRHSDTLLSFAKKADLNITRVYKEVVSGDSLFTRPQMVRLLADAEQGKFYAVLCMDIDRLGRSSQKDGGIILETFKENNIYIITPQKTYNLNDEIDETSVEMQSFIARQELKSITRRLQRGMIKSLEEGCHIGDIPYGYKRVYIGKKPTLEPVPEQAEVIRLVFDMYVNQHLGSHTIADRLNALGYKTRDNKPFSRTSVRLFLSNPVYIGKIVWNRNHHIKRKSINDKHKTIRNPSDKWIVAQGLHPAIIDEATFQEAQNIRAGRSHPPAYTGVIQNPFAGLIFCKNCGGTMVRQASKKLAPRLMCAQTNCNKSVEMYLVEERILNFLHNVLQDIKAKQNEENARGINERINELRPAISAAKKELAQLQTQKKRLHDLLEQNVYDIPTFLERSNDLASRIRDAENAISELTAQVKQICDAPSYVEVLPTLERLLTEYDILSPADKNLMLKQIVKRITYDRTKHVWGNDFSINIELTFDI